MNADAAAIIVRSDAPWKSLREFMEDIQANPGKRTMSGTSTGGAWDLARAGFQLAAGLPVESVRWIPTKGAAPSIVELLGGHIDSVCCSVPEAITQIEAGQLRALAVMSSKRLPEYPDIPTVRESDIDLPRPLDRPFFKRIRFLHDIDDTAVFGVFSRSIVENV